MTHDSDVVAVATVVDTLPARWSTPDEKRPDLTMREILDDLTIFIYTPYVLEVHELLKGSLPEPQVIVSFRGGRVGQDVSGHILGKPLAVGQEVVVFLDDRLDFVPQYGELVRWQYLDRYVLEGGKAIGTMPSWHAYSEEELRAIIHQAVSDPDSVKPHWDLTDPGGGAQH